jgi:hypothetical protein
LEIASLEITLLEIARVAALESPGTKCRSTIYRALAYYSLNLLINPCNNFVSSIMSCSN